MELEAKHLIPYLPFKLKMIFEGKGGRIIELSNVTISELGVAISGGYGAMWLKSSKFLPILIPLSELSAYSNGIKHLGYGRGGFEIQKLVYFRKFNQRTKAESLHF